MTDVDIIEGKDQMKDERTLQIRYFGADWNRYHCLQRGDGTYWTGDAGRRFSIVPRSSVITEKHNGNASFFTAGSMAASSCAHFG